MNAWTVVFLKRFLLCILFLLLLCACAVPPQVIDLDLYSDRGFARQVEEIFAAAVQHEGAAIRLTGQSYESGDYAYILRTAPDGEVHGFELLWEGARPEAGAWILAVGRLQSYQVDGTRYLQVAAQRLYCTDRSSEEICIREEAFLADLAQLYEHPEKYLGAQVTLTGLYGEGAVFRTADYLDGRTGRVGLECLCLTEPPEEGSWVTATGTLGTYERDGEKILILIDAVLSSAEQQEEPVKETP